ncbi:unnamed protein product [Nesidiocoris tenuis]|uniref:Uncharacterized protein n=1 Tax=Nesidiocoris tenuis TaxID=355587 RepID=A0A6H5H458_9HEMI|nr:unnamed protein product [Nesidiocoris tenuis]
MIHYPPCFPKPCSSCDGSGAIILKNYTKIQPSTGTKWVLMMEPMRIIKENKDRNSPFRQVQRYERCPQRKNGSPSRLEHLDSPKDCSPYTIHRSRCLEFVLRSVFKTPFFHTLNTAPQVLTKHRAITSNLLLDRTRFPTRDDSGWFFSTSNRRTVVRQSRCKGGLSSDRTASGRKAIEKSKKSYNK